MKKVLILFFSCIFFTTHVVYADEGPIKNAGFVTSNIWYSKDPFFEGDRIRIYTILFNGSTYDLTGNVEFLDNGELVGRTNFSLAGSGRVQDVWVNWDATLGTHVITARLANVIADGPNGKFSVLLASNETGESTRTVEVDPAVLEAEAVARAKKISDAVDTVQNTVNVINDSIPVPVKENVFSGVNFIEAFREKEAEQFKIAKEKKANEIVAINSIADNSSDSQTKPSLNVSKNGVIRDSATETSGSVAKSSRTMEKPLAYVSYAALAVLQYVFQFAILFYAIFLYLIYRLIKWGIQKYRNRGY